jgi:hypothetical protein
MAPAGNVIGAIAQTVIPVLQLTFRQTHFQLTQTMEAVGNAIEVIDKSKEPAKA